MTSRGNSSGAAAVPVVLPQVVVLPEGDDTVTVTTVGRDVTTSVRQAELGAALAEIADQTGGPIRVEIHEPDGTRYADIVTPPSATLDPPAGPTQKRRRRRQDIEIAGGGFLPGETVLVAVTAQTEIADHTGHVTVRLDHRTTPSRAAGVLVFGTVSSTLLLTDPS